jgi:hypothetical protein
MIIDTPSAAPVSPGPGGMTVKERELEFSDVIRVGSSFSRSHVVQLNPPTRSTPDGSEMGARNDWLHTKTRPRPVLASSMPRSRLCTGLDRKRRDGVELRLEPGKVVGRLRSGHRPISQHARRLLGQVVSSLEKPRLEEPIVLRYAGEIGGSSRSAA